MNNLSFFKFILLITITLTIAVTVSDARGGRRGGSFGGIFGGWRKYKKPGSHGTGNHRRPVISGSPVAAESPSQHQGSISSSRVKKTHVHHDNHQRDPPPPYPGTDGSSHLTHDPPPPYPGLTDAGFRLQSHRYYGGASGAEHLPPGGTYHVNPSSIPQGALYYAQPPVTSSGSIDYQLGLRVGHALSGNNHHHVRVHHHHTNNNNQEQKPAATTQNGTNVNIIENGNSTTVVPLAPLSTNIPPATAGAGAPDTSAGIICVPMLFDEIDSNDPTKIVKVQKTICYPAPPPLPPNCAIRTFIEADPTSPTKTIEVQRQICNSDSTTNRPIQVAGEIGEQTARRNH